MQIRQQCDVSSTEFITKKVTSAVYGAEGVEDDRTEEDLQETVILQLSAMDMNSLMKASYTLDTFQEEEFLSEVCVDSQSQLLLSPTLQY